MNKKLISYLALVLCMCLSSGCTAADESMQQEENISDVVAQEGNELEEKSEVNMQGKISVSTYFEDAYLEEAAEKFMVEYPDVEIEIHTFSNPTDNVEIAGGGSMSTLDDDPNTTFEKYLTQLNVEFMGGNAEDMLCLYGMPVYKYIDSGYLMDMADLLAEDAAINDETYYMNIINAMGYKEGIYNIPLGYSMKLATINEDYINNIDLPESNVWQINNMIEIAEKVHQQGNNCPMSMVSAQALFNQVFKLEANSFIDITTKAVKLESQEFIDLLEKCKKLGDDGYLSAEGERGLELPLFYEGDTYSHTIYNEDYYTSSESRYIECKPLTDSKGNITIDTINSYGINNNSENKALCFEFMKFLLSKEMQEKASLDALPINKLAAETKANYMIKNVVAGMKEYGNSFSVSDDELVKDYLNHIDEWSKQVNMYTMLEKGILEAVYEEVGSYFKGEKTAKDVSKILQNRIHVMLNE